MFEFRRLNRGHPVRRQIPQGKWRSSGVLRTALLLGVLLASGLPGPLAYGVIIATGDGTGNTSAPADDPGFDSVGVVHGLSGVYLGNGWVLTANHVGQGSMEFGGITYPVIPGSWRRLVGDLSNPPDLALLRMVGDPGLPVAALATTTPPAGSNVVMIGNGLSRGRALSWGGNDGWHWTAPTVKRWGRNRVSSTGAVVLDTESIILTFDPPGPIAVNDEAHVAVGDSGGGLFWKSGGTWYLAGTLFVSLTTNGQPSNVSLYGNGTAAADISHYRTEILDIISVPACSNGLDDDLDGQVDSGADPGCDNASDPSEQSAALVCDDGLDNDLDGLIDYPADPGCTSSTSPDEDADWDGDTIPNTSDNCPLIANLDQLNTDGDAEGDVCDEDDDNDGLLDSVETNTGIFLSPTDTGSDPLNPDSDGDGIPDGNDIAPNDVGVCASVNPQLNIAWGHATPFGLVHRNDPGIGHLFLLDEDPSLGLPGYSETDPIVLADQMENVVDRVDELLNKGRPGTLPPTLRALEVSGLADGDSLPEPGGAGTPSLIYLVDRSALEISDPDFGPLAGFAWSKPDRFTNGCIGGQGVVIVDAIPPESDPAFQDSIDNLVEEIAHQAGHLYGQRHILADGLSACTGQIPGPTAAVMDGFADGESAEVMDCTDALGTACPVTEPPDCTGEETGETHNPLYYFLHYLIGDSTVELATASLTPGAWDMESDPLVSWRVEFDFACTGGGGCGALPLYETSIIEVLPSDGEILRQSYPVITLDEINALQILVPESSGMKLTASTVDPSGMPGGLSVPDLFLERPIYPPAFIGQAPTIAATLLQVQESSPGVYTTVQFASDGAVTATPQYETRTDGTWDLTDPGQPAGFLLSTSTYPPPLSVIGAPVAVPEPGSTAAFAAGITGLLALGYRRRRNHQADRSSH